MDKIFIKNFEVFANHGVFEEEKTLGQKFILDIELSLNTRIAAKTGDLSLSVHYGELAHKLEKEFKKESIDLIETVAENMAEFILLEYEVVKEVLIRVKKPWAPIHRSLDTVYVEIKRKWNEAYLSFGSNLGDSENNIKEGLTLLGNSYHTKVEKISSIIKTKPWGFEEQDDFLNGACKIKTLLTPIELIDFILDIESKLKRERILRWGPRTLDLDIIFYNDLITDDDIATLPHPRMQLREFVLEPLCEIAPNKIHPLLNKRVFELLDDIKNKES